MRICYVYPRFTGLFGGERLVLSLASQSARAGNEVALYTHKFSEACTPILDKRVRLVQTGFIPTGSHNLDSLLDFIFMPVLCARISGRFDILHAMQWQSAPASIFARGKAGVLIYGCNEPPRAFYDLEEETRASMNFAGRLAFPLVAPVVRALDKFFVKKFGGIISNSEWTAAQAEKIYGRKSVIICPGVEKKRFAGITKNDARRRLGMPQDATIFLSVSKLHRRKRVDEAMRVFGRRKEKNKHFLVVGSGPELKNLSALASKIHGVRMVGAVEEVELPLYYEAADYFIFTAKNEPFGLAPLEAKAAGCKILPKDFRRPIISWHAHAAAVLSIYKNMLQKRRLQ